MCSIFRTSFLLLVRKNYQLSKIHLELWRPPCLRVVQSCCHIKKQSGALIDELSVLRSASYYILNPVCRWYRARVLEVNKDNEFHVFYVDHGDIEWVSEKRLWAAWPEILEVRFIIHSCLYSVVTLTKVNYIWT